jgi:pyroglutamyl-peptidase
MKQLLITGFDPFGGASVNPAREAVMALPDVVGDYALTKLEIPTVFGLAAETVLRAAEILCPDVILCVGQAGGRAAITPEVVAINLREASIPDNAGNQPKNMPVVENAPAAYFSTLPVRAMAEGVKAAGIPCSLSYSAGVFVCNDLLYTLLHHYDGTDTRVGFVHIPYLPEQAGEGVASLPLEDAVRGLTAAIQAIT